MELEYPYQVVAFLDQEPAIGEPIYAGENGWYPHVTLKRRFKIEGISEDDLIHKLATYCTGMPTLTITTGNVTKPDRMPVDVIKVEPSAALLHFHTGLIEFLGNAILSRYPERDGARYLPHITAEFNNSMVIDVEKYQHQTIPLHAAYLIKDLTDENAVAYHRFGFKAE